MSAQEERLRAYATLSGLTVTTLIREEGVSAKIPLANRPGGREMQRLIQSSQAQHVIALKLDRLFRDAEDALRQTREWDGGNVTLHVLDLGGQMVNTASPMGRMLLTVIAAMAELERSLIAERTAQALAHKKKHLEVYSPTPLGFRREGNMLVPDPDEQSLVARMRQMHNEGRSLRGIADQLNAEGIVGKAGGRWYATTVKKVLGNGIHTQERRHSPD